MTTSSMYALWWEKATLVWVRAEFYLRPWQDTLVFTNQSETGKLSLGLVMILCVDNDLLQF